MPEVTDLSVSRVKVLDKCELAYDYQYVQRLPAPSEKATKVFGTVVHVGVERWYGEPGSENHRNTDLRGYVAAVWTEVLPAPVLSALQQCIQAENTLAGLAQAILISRPELKNVRQTKDFLSSPEFKHFEEQRDRLLDASDKNKEMSWGKDENAFQAYQKSIFIADTLQQRWQQKARPLLVEGQFSVEFAGLRIRGRIDQIRRDPDPTTGEIAGTELLDIKTGKQIMTQMDAFLQAFLYFEACYLDPELPEIDWVTYHMARHNRCQHGRIDRQRHGRLATRILHSVKRRIESSDKAPSYGMWCKSCDFADLCAKEISMWPVGQDTLVLNGQQKAAA